VVCDMNHTCILRIREGLQKPGLPIVVPDLDVDAKGVRKRLHLHIVAIGTAAGHVIQMAPELGVDLSGGRRCLQGAGILPLWLTVSTPDGSQEGLVLVGMLLHMIDHSSAKLGMLGLVSVQLFGEGVKEAVAYWRRSISLESEPGAIKPDPELPSNQTPALTVSVCLRRV
jgi:hypothetical protein